MTPVRYDPRTDILHFADGRTCSAVEVEANRRTWPRVLVDECDRIMKRDREAMRVAIYTFLSERRPDIFPTLH